ncbi:hypothetical protein FRC04_009523 [Tulasnella sp. 424]|nr:hypothetical protein FRC04_009523 [Tulasnella sp. 424]
MLNPSKQHPTVGPGSRQRESATSSASPSRTATPATTAYETAGYETPMASRTPSLVNSKNELVPFTHTFLTPSLAPGEGDQSTITYFKIFDQFDVSKPIFSRFRDTADAPELRIPWRFLRVLTGPRVQPSITVSLVITTAPPAPKQTSFDYILSALAHFLDQSGGHDVVFCFPDRYADRDVLQRASPSFRNFFEVRNQESGIVPGVGVGIGAGVGQGKSALADDSDVEMIPTKGRMLHDDRAGAVVRPGRAERVGGDITTLAGSTVITPMTSVHGEGVQDNISLPLDTKGLMFQRTTSPLMDDNIFVMNINETSFNTFRAFLYYLYTAFTSFSPLTPSFQFPDQPDPWSPGQPSTLEQRRLEARNTLVTKKYEIPSLEAQALSRISTAIFNPLVATAELLSAFTRVAKEKGKAQPDQYFAGVLCEILEALPPRSA